MLSDAANRLWRYTPEIKKTYGEALDKRYLAQMGNIIPIF